MKNQILNTKIKKNSDKIFFKFQFTISIVIILILISVICYYLFSLHKKEKSSNNVIDNYNIYKLYSNSYLNKSYNNTSQSEFFGVIQIPKINLYYSVFSHLDENLLKVSPCKFYGDSPKTYGNICIAGHNYNNSMFFSNLFLLDNNDEIYIYDTNNEKYTYIVFKSYEVIPSDLSPLFNYENNSKELTLITCNNLNSNRLIIKAKQIE